MSIFIDQHIVLQEPRGYETGFQDFLPSAISNLNHHGRRWSNLTVDLSVYKDLVSSWLGVLVDVVQVG